jgi:hypothetical protein
VDLEPLLRSHPAIRSVELIGSRGRGDANELSDWDYAVDVSEFDAVARDLPRLVAPLDPLAEQWDPLAELPTYMLMLPGPTKVDLLFVHETWQKRPPWGPSRKTLPAIDAHFWDWLLWLAQKRRRGKDELVREELVKLHGYLLGPMGVLRPPRDLEGAMHAYLEARGRLEEIYGIKVPRALEEAVRPVLAS